ncbi:hypothetical protein ILP74_13875 [Citrobacter amalonaticus]|uniref:hypothetical protein n=1 Tax=Citrobacter amalonaticus TaxID=35703 RepID=UPI0017878557|nr:hypothetical protein [Citrobacter amalonaticus]MBE0396507.1 hypothetical protein [Citrobacter amalonaticus]
MELSNQFTKEQLIATTRALIASQRHIIESGVYGIDVVAFYRQKLAISEIALASLTSEPVAWTDEQELRDVRRVGFGEMFSVEPVSPNADMCRVIPLYRHAPPAPIVPGEMPMPKASKMSPIDAVVAIAEVRGWNAFRAAMLKGGAK